jgi:hypothetical protein
MRSGGWNDSAGIKFPQWEHSVFSRACRWSSAMTRAYVLIAAGLMPILFLLAANMIVA